jgi:signal transduction histidine kinase
VEQRDGRVVVSVSDNGHAGPDGEVPPYLSMDYAAMRERIREAGGTLRMRTGDDGHRTAEISVPLPPQQPENS